MVPLPYEVLTMVILLAAQEDQKTAVQLASVCWDFANVYVIPSIGTLLVPHRLPQKLNALIS